MTVALIHSLPTGDDAAGLAGRWSASFRPADFGAEPTGGPVEAFGPALPDDVRGLTLTATGAGAAGVALFDSWADARRCEPELREFWSGLAGAEVAAAEPVAVWVPATGDVQPARMIWRAPAPEPLAAG
ncbi:MAG TPA: hypothetical protein VGD67_09800 [Pseudonocardiaceae bacterium]